jgi:hypothetical protein
MEHLMEVSTTRILTPARIVALMTIVANLLLLALDIASVSQPGGRVVEGNPSERPVLLQA